jgi:alpha-N-arabinofuranosidase
MNVLKWIAAGVALAGGVSAMEYHVAKSGSDGNPGTGASPFLTIQHAADFD